MNTYDSVVSYRSAFPIRPFISSRTSNRVPKLFFFSLTILLFFDTMAWGQVVAWNTTSLSGITSGNVNATTNNGNLNIALLSRGSGITAASLTSGYSSSGWTDANRADAIINNRYDQCTINAKSSFQVSLSTLDSRLRRTSTGPNAYLWRYSTDGTNFTDIGSSVSFITTGSTGDAQSQISLSGISTLQNVQSASTITLRLYAWGASSSAGTLAFGTTNANSLAIGGIVSAGSSTNSDIIAAGKETSNINYAGYQSSTITSTTDGVRVWSFTVRDGGGSADGDALPTILSSVTLNQGSGNGIASWSSVIRQATLFDGSTKIADVTTIGSTTLSFTGLSGTHVTASDDASKTIDLVVTFTTAVIDNSQFQFQITNANVGAASGGTSSSLTSFSAQTSSTATDANRIEVTATKLRFTMNPPASVGQSANFSATVAAQDANNNTDLDYSGDFTLSVQTGTGTLSSVTGLSRAPSSGTVSWSNLRYSTVENGVVIAAASGNLSNALSTSFDVAPNFSSNSDIIAVASSEAATISTLVNAASPLSSSDGVQIWQVTVRDGGGSADADGLPTIVNAMIFSQAASGNSVADWSAAILAADLFDGTTHLARGTVGVSSIAFVGLMVSVPDDGNKTLSLRISLKNSLSVGSDGQSFRIRITAANSTGASSASSSQFASFSDAVSASGQNVIAVVATKLAFTTQPQSGVLTAQTTGLVAISARDANDNTDLDFTGAVTLSSGTFSLSSTDAGGLTKNAVSGVVSWTNLTSSTAGTGTIIASATGPGSTTSNSITINADPATILFRSSATGNWNDVATWEMSTNAGSMWQNATSTPTSSNSTVTIRNGHNVTVSTAVTIDEVVADLGGQITIPSSVTLTIANGTGTDLVVNGILNTAGTITMNSGAAVSFGSGGKYQHNYTTSAGTIPTATWDINSTCEIVGYTTNATNLSGLNQSFGNFSWNCPNQTGNISAAGNFTTVNGKLAIIATNTGSFRLSASTSPILAVGGNLEITGGTFSICSGSGSPIVNVAGSVVVSGGTLNLGVTTSQTGSAKLSATGNVIVNGGTLDLKANNAAGGNTLEVGGDLLVSSGALTQTGSTSGSDGTIRFMGGTGASNLSYSGGTVTPTYIKYDIASSKTVNTLNGLFISSSRSLTVSGTLVCGTNSISGSGNVSLLSGATLSIGSAAGITTSGATGNIQVTGTRTYDSGANYTYSGSSPQVTGDGLPSSVSNLIISTTTGVTLTKSVATNGRLTLNSGSFSVGANTLTINGAISTTGGSLTGGSTSTIVIGGSGGSTTLPAVSVSALTLNRTAGMNLGGAVNIVSVLTLTSGTLNNSANGLTLGSAATISRATGSLSTAPTFGATVNLEYTGSSSLTTGPELPIAVTVLNNLTIGSGGTKTFSSSATVQSTLTITGAELADGGNTISVNGDVVNNGTHTGSGKVKLTVGSAAHTLTGSGTYQNIELDDARGVTVSGTNLSVNGTLTFTNGTITTGGNQVVFGPNGATAGTTAARYIVGTVQKYFLAGTQSFIFPIGDAINYTPIDISSLSVTSPGTITASTTATDHPNIATSGLITSKTVNRYWKLLPAGGLTVSAGNATFTFVAGDIDAGANTNNFVVRSYNGTSWVGLSPGTMTSTTAQVTGISSFSDFAIGEPGAGVAATLSLSSGNNQSAKVTESLANPFVVTVLDYFNNPVQGVGVTFSIASVPAGALGQTLSVVNTTTGINGQASTTLALGKKTGQYLVTASSTGLLTMTFTSSASAGAATNLLVTAGDNQALPILSPLSPFVVTVRDNNANPVPGITVNFFLQLVPPGSTGAVLSRQSAVTDASGQVSTVLVFGTKSGQYLAGAFIPNSNLSVLFNTMAVAGPPSQIIKVGGDNQSSPINTNLPSPYVVQLTDAGGNPLSGLTVSFTLLSAPQGAIGQSTTPASRVTDANGFASTSVKLGTVAGQYRFYASSPAVGGVFVSWTATATALTAVGDFGSIPMELELLPNYPNPFNPSTKIRFGLPERGHIRIEITDMLGNVVAQLINEDRDPGFHEVAWQVDGLSSGLYVVRVSGQSLSTSKTFASSRKMMLLK